MRTRIDSVQAKVRRAEKHIRDLEAAVSEFTKTEPYKLGVRPNPQIPQLIQAYICEAAEIPVEIPLICSDAIQNLRSALDHLVHQLVLACGNTPDRDTAFPVSIGPTEYGRESQVKLKLVSPDAKKAIDDLKPYKGGNDLLWRLHKLNNLDKHRLLIAVGTSIAAIDAFSHWAKRVPQFAAFARHAFQFIPEDKMCPLKAGDVVFEDTQLNEGMKVTFHIAFGEPHVSNGEPMIFTLHEMAKLVRGIVSSFAQVL